MQTDLGTGKNKRILAERLNRKECECSVLLCGYCAVQDLRQHDNGLSNKTSKSCFQVNDTFRKFNIILILIQQR